MKTKQNVYDRVTDKILSALESGVKPWIKPWHTDGNDANIQRPKRHNGEHYAGVNTLMLWCEASDKEYTSDTWMTYNQAKALGGQVRKGSKGAPVVYANSGKKIETDKDTGEETEKRFSVMKGYTVFNVDCIDDLPEKYYAKPEAPNLNPTEKNDRLEKFFQDTGADIKAGGNRAFYAPSTDTVNMPPIDLFKEQAGYYATLAHEIVHWTKHNKRMDRDFGAKRFGDKGYAVEELVAEIGSAFLSAELGICPDDVQNHADYMASWLHVLQTDNRAIFTAAAHAQRAVDFILAKVAE